MEHPLQVSAQHYFNKRYLHKDRWLNYWYQTKWVLECDVKRVLEIGVGNRIVADTLAKLGHEVETVDIDPALKPTHVASITALPLADASCDLVLCAEVLEHMPFEESMKAMRELHRVTKKYALITLPHAGWTFSLIFKIPMIRWQCWGTKIPHFWKTHAFNGQHYWETGKKRYSRKRLKQAIESVGFDVKRMKVHPDDPGHSFYLCEKRTP